MKRYETLIICIDEYLNSFDSVKGFIESKTPNFNTTPDTPNTTETPVTIVTVQDEALSNKYKNLNVSYQKQRQELTVLEKQYDDLSKSKLGKIQLAVWNRRAKKAKKAELEKTKK